MQFFKNLNISFINNTTNKDTEMLVCVQSDLLQRDGCVLVRQQVTQIRVIQISLDLK